jgi:hypothetical protein
VKKTLLLCEQQRGEVDGVGIGIQKKYLKGFFDICKASIIGATWFIWFFVTKEKCILPKLNEGGVPDSNQYLWKAGK